VDPHTIDSIGSIDLKRSGSQNSQNTQNSQMDDTKDTMENGGDHSSLSSTFSDASLGEREGPIPFPESNSTESTPHRVSTPRSNGHSTTTITTSSHSAPPSESNMQNHSNSVKFTFKKAKKKRKLNASRSANLLLTDSPIPSPLPERTPSISERTVFNQLHETRRACTDSQSLKRSYESSEGSRNRRNRSIKQSSPKLRGDIRMKKQIKAHQQKIAKQMARQTHSEHTQNGWRNNGKTEREEDTDDTIEVPAISMNTSYSNHSNSSLSLLEEEEECGPMTRSKQRMMSERAMMRSNQSPDWLRRGVSCRQPVGLQNMGNTCFMNSTLQSLIHTEELRHFFLSNDRNRWYSQQLNQDNPIGYGGRIAVQFAKLIYQYCGSSPSQSYYSGVRPWNLHHSLSGALRQFADYRQHDAQEFLTTFLDAIHEDLNRIKKKEYIEIPDFDRYEESAEREREFLNLRWNGIYLRRNRSICTDLFAGLLRSTVTCPQCEFRAITFDPFMHLLVPLKASRSMQRALFPTPSGLGMSSPTRYTHHHHNGRPCGPHRAPLGALSKNGRDLKRKRFLDSDESLSAVTGDDEEEMHCEITFHFLPMDVKKPPSPITVSVAKEVVTGNDWVTLHALIYEKLLDRFEGDPEGATSDTAVTAEAMAKYRRRMIESAHYAEDPATSSGHFLYYTRDLVEAVKRHNGREQVIPKSMDDAEPLTIPMFEVMEMAQSGKILHFRSISKTEFNDRIEDYTAKHEIKRMVVQQLPQFWSLPKMKEQHGDQRVDCYVVFKRPSFELALPQNTESAQSNGHRNGSNDVDVDGDRDKEGDDKGGDKGGDDGDDELSKSVQKDLDLLLPSISPTSSTTEESPYEPFHFPRVIFEKGLTGIMDEERMVEWVHGNVHGLITSIAGEEAVEKQFEIRYTRSDEAYSLDRIEKWAKVMAHGDSSTTTNSHCSNGDTARRRPIRTMVIVFSFEMQQIYSQFQREEEEKRETMEIRKKRYLAKKQREQREQRQRSGGLPRKRSFEVMNGGNSAYNRGRKRQRMDVDHPNGNGVNGVNRGNGQNGHNRHHRQMNGHRHSNGHRSDRSDRTPNGERRMNGHAHRGVADGNEENMDEIRDASLPAEFQPTGSMARDIKQCFGMFLSREQLGRDNKWFCKKCKEHVMGWKKLDLWWLPTHLIIAIKRFDNHGRRKYSEAVHYPVNGLDLSEIIRGGDSLDIYRDQLGGDWKGPKGAGEASKVRAAEKGKGNKERFLYDLYAVINHSGSLNFGHYTATVKFGKEWFSISDSSVTRCYGDPVSSSAYILCYKQRQTRL